MPRKPSVSTTLLPRIDLFTLTGKQNYHKTTFQQMIKQINILKFIFTWQNDLWKNYRMCYKRLYYRYAN